MKRFFIIATLLAAVHARAQENVLPAPKQSGPIVIRNVTVHVGNGQVLSGATVAFENGRITSVNGAGTPAGARVIDGTGKQLYPGLILASTDLGLVEVPSVRASSDVQEVGEANPSVRALVAYNTDSKVINTLRPNGILLANIVPQGGWISGASSVVQLDAWNWEDAAYKTDNGLHIYMPALISRPRGFRALSAAGDIDPIRQGLEQVDRMKQFFREAKAYGAAHTETNLGFEAVQGLYNKSKKLFVHANTVRQMLVALDFVREFGFDMVIVGGIDSWQIAELLAQNKVGVILSQLHNLPTLEDDDVDQPFKTPAALQKAGVVFAITDEDGNTRGRNLPFNAGTAAAYGLTNEQALSAITLNAAKLLGVDDRTGSIEVGKDANLVLCSGDILDMRTNIVTNAFIQGRDVPLVNKQTQLYERYKTKYGFK
ncbi:amidohydrolase [Flaviaesturariibacter flavus]|uniref:Amidohydrolase n=1 Tax=Flaviaesturariibacter flavus TaxID=2502780 RepID=A0A4V2NWT4_9BACT|nr:amidohydrolase family protein [Flaviaesturariibacter flavus]TCJ18622.1 amidohydrolase [Flaviaesturariibacter flavus]